MAPPKRLLKEVESGNEVTPTAEVSEGRRVTRSLTNPDSPVQPQRQPPKKKAKTPTKKKGESSSSAAPAEDDAAEEENANVQGSETKDDDGGSGSGSKKVDAGSSRSGSKKGAAKATGSGSKKRNAASGSRATNVAVESSTMCSRFRTRAQRVKEGLEKAIPGINVIINPEKPRQGSFEVRNEATKEKYISLVDTKRPFKRLQEVDIEQLIADIVAKLQE